MHILCGFVRAAVYRGRRPGDPTPELDKLLRQVAGAKDLLPQQHQDEQHAQELPTRKEKLKDV